VRVIAALLPSTAGQMLLQELVKSGAVVMEVSPGNETNTENNNNSNNNNSSTENESNSIAIEKKKNVIALPVCLEKINLVMMESRAITDWQDLSIGMPIFATYIFFLGSFAHC
jgi:hypothetical protein